MTGPEYNKALPKAANEMLLKAAAEKDLAGVKRALDRGAEIDARDDAGKTPLMHAAATGDAASVEALIARGAELDLRDALGMTAVFHAVSGNNYPHLTALLNAGADPNIPATNTMTPLMRAAGLNAPSMASVLLKAKAAPDAQDKNGRTALHKVVLQLKLFNKNMGADKREGYKQILHDLIMAGARTDVEDRQKQTPLSLAQEPTGKVAQIIEAAERERDLSVIRGGTKRSMKLRQMGGFTP